MSNVVPLLSDEQAARRHWHKTAERILELFREARGHDDPETMDELEAWAASSAGKAILDGDAQLAELRGK